MSRNDHHHEYFDDYHPYEYLYYHHDSDWHSYYNTHHYGEHGVDYNPTRSKFLHIVSMLSLLY